MTNLSKRLECIASFIQKDDKVIDVGCDHGYLSIYLAKTKQCSDIIASDVNQNALNNAISNIKKEKLNKTIKTTLSDGLKQIDVINYDTLIISGMGTNTILNILNDKEKLTSIKKIIIQSNNDHYLLRKEMKKRGFFIAQEKIIFDRKYYIVICFKKGYKNYSNIELKYGPYLIHEKSNKEYFKYLHDKKLLIYNKIPHNKLILRLKMNRELKIIKKIIL